MAKKPPRRPAPELEAAPAAPELEAPASPSPELEAPDEKPAGLADIRAELEAAPELEAPASILDVLPAAPALSPAPDAAAALAESLGAPQSAYTQGPTEPAAPAAAGAAAPGQWSRAKIRAAKKGELQRRITELQQQVRQQGPASPSSSSGPAAPAPEASSAEIKEQLDLILLGVDALAVHFGHPALKIDARERATLAGAFVPAVSPHFGAVRSQFPWAMGLVAALGIYVPKGLEAAKQMREAKARARLEGAEPVASSSSAPPATGDHPLFGDTWGTPNAQGNALPFGGPRE